MAGILGRVFRGLCEGEHLGRRLVPGVGQVVQKDARSPQVAVDDRGPGLLLINGQPPTSGVVQFVRVGVEVPLAHRRVYFESRIEGGQRSLQSHLIVAARRGAVGDRQTALLAGQVDQLAGNDIARQGRAEEAGTLVHRIRLEDGQREIPKELGTAIDDGRGRGAEFQGQLAQRFKVDFLPEVERQRDDLVAALMAQPVQCQARFEIAVECQDNPGHVVPFASSNRQARL